MRALLVVATTLLTMPLLTWSQSGPGVTQTKSDKERSDSVELSLAEFKKTWSETKSLAEKADALRTLAPGEAKDARIVRLLGRFLNPTSEDADYLLPLAAADRLGTFRGDPGASSLLVGALGTYKKVPKMQLIIVAAMGRNGHESIVPILIERLRDLSANPEVAQTAAAAFGNMPIEVALPPLLKEWGELNRKRFKEANYPMVAGTILTSVQKLTGQGYRTTAEFEIWWARNSHEFANSAGSAKK
jgi:hypothetical protein